MGFTLEMCYNERLNKVDKHPPEVDGFVNQVDEMITIFLSLTVWFVNGKPRPRNS